MGAGGAAIVLAVAGFAYLYIDMNVYTVTVVNRSTQMLSDVRVVMPGRARSLGTLTPGASGWAYTMPKTSGTLDIAFIVAGKPKHQMVDYVASGLGKSYTLTVTPALTVRDTTPGHQP